METPRKKPGWRRTKNWCFGDKWEGVILMHIVQLFAPLGHMLSLDQPRQTVVISVHTSGCN